MNGWDEHEHPRWPAHTPDSRGGEFRDGDTPGGWLAEIGNPHGFMTHAQVDSYVGRDDFTEEMLAGGNSAYTTLRTYSDGRRMVWKNHDDGEYFEGEDQKADIEVVASWIGWAAGAPVPAVVMDNEPEATLSEYIPGEVGAAAIKRQLGPDAISPSLVIRTEKEYVETLPGAWQLGLMDLLIGNDDRHPGNWIIRPDGHVVGIDHANARIAFPSTLSPFTSWFVDRYGDHSYINNPMTAAQANQTIRRLELLHERGMFSTPQLEDMTSTLKLIRKYARPG